MASSGSRLLPIERAFRYLADCPPAVSGQQGHNQTYRAACLLLHGFGLSQSDSLTVLRCWNERCLPPWSERELIHKLKSAAVAKSRYPRGWMLNPKRCNGIPAFVQPAFSIGTEARPQFNAESLRRIASKAAAVIDVISFLARKSPVRVDTQDSASVLRRLYTRGSGEKVLIFSHLKSQGQLVWEADCSDVIQDAHLPRGAKGVWFLPQPVTGTFHPNPREDNKLSRRSEEAVTSWRYLLLESDEADADDWLRCLIQMPLRISSICSSGGRSIHALVRVDASSKEDWDRCVGTIKPALVALGADPGALTAVRLSRLPQAKRGERAQTLLYLNPQPVNTPIFHRL